MHAEFGLDLLDFFRGIYPWGKLDRLTDRLLRMPRSALQIALAQDEEAAEHQLAADDDAPSASNKPPLESWSPEVEWLAANFDRMGELIQAVVAGIPGGKPPRIRPAPRPETALDRARRRRAWTRHDALVAEVEAAQARRADGRG